MKFNWTQFGIAFGLFLLGYLTFNSPWFTGSKDKAAPVAPAAVVAPAAGTATGSADGSTAAPVLPSRR